MTPPDPSGEAAPDTGGATTPVSGTPFPVDFTRDRRARITWVVLLAGPVIWFSHFMAVYLVAEAGCTGDGHGLALFDPPVPTVVTLLATAVAIVLCCQFAAWSHRRWQESVRRDEPGPDPAADGDAGGRGSLAFAGMLLSLLSALAVLSVGLPALVLPSC